MFTERDKANEFAKLRVDHKERRAGSHLLRVDLPPDRTRSDDVGFTDIVLRTGGAEMKIYKNTHKGAPLMDAIDEYATAYEARNSAHRVDLWRRVRVHMVGKLSIPEKDVTDKDLAYFVKRMGPSYLIRKIHTMDTVSANQMLAWAVSVEAGK